MKAVLCTHYGPPEELTLAEVEPPTPGQRQVLIAVKAAGVNFPDTLIIQGKYQLQPPLPFAPGSEIAGGGLRSARDERAEERAMT